MVAAGQALSLVYLEVLLQYTADNNAGTTCADVYLTYEGVQTSGCIAAFPGRRLQAMGAHVGALCGSEACRPITFTSRKRTVESCP